MHPHKKILMSYSISINTIRCEKKPTDDDVADVPTTAAQWLFICMLYESRFFKTCNLTFLGRDLTFINVHLYSTRVATNCIWMNILFITVFGTQTFDCICGMLIHLYPTIPMRWWWCNSSNVPFTVMFLLIKRNIIDF